MMKSDTDSGRSKRSRKVQQAMVWKPKNCEFEHNSHEAFVTQKQSSSTFFLIYGMQFSSAIQEYLSTLLHQAKCHPSHIFDACVHVQFARKPSGGLMMGPWFRLCTAVQIGETWSNNPCKCCSDVCTQHSTLDLSGCSCQKPHRIAVNYCTIVKCAEGFGGGESQQTFGWAGEEGLLTLACSLRKAASFFSAAWLAISACGRFNSVDVFIGMGLALIFLDKTEKWRHPTSTHGSHAES